MQLILLFRPVGMPYVQSVILSNPSDTNDIEITAVNVQPPFHSTKFQKKVCYFVYFTDHQAIVG